jgi:predicted RNA-binding Zn ribbon-like protein
MGGDKGREHAAERTAAGPEALLLIGGSLCLDLANTVDRRGSGRARDRLRDYDDLIVWTVRAGALEGEVADRVRARAAAEPEAAAATLARARWLRAAVYRVGAAVAAGGSLPSAALETLSHEAFALVARTRLAPLSDGATFGRAWDSAEEDALERPLWAVAWSVAELLLIGRGDAGRLRECANADCHWLFVDRSRNRSRRWCAMETCGNVLKARRRWRRRG